MADPITAGTGKTPSRPRPAASRRTAPAPKAPAAPAAPARTAAAAEPAPETAARPPIVPPPAAPTAPPPAAPPANVTAAPASSASAGASPAERDSQALLYGLIVVVLGFAAILIGLVVVLINVKAGSDATALLGVVTTAIAGLGGAFFGIAIGQHGTASANRDRAAAEAAKDEAQMRTIRFAANMDPSVGRRLVE